MTLHQNKNVYSCFVLDRYFYIYIYCRKFNAEFIKLIKTVRHHARLKK